MTNFDFSSEWEVDVRSNLPADFGLMRYYPNLGTPFTSQVSYVSWSRIKESWDEYNKLYTEYDTKVAAYEILRDEYNIKIEKNDAAKSTPLGLFT